MFPISITLTVNNLEQLNALQAVFSGESPKPAAAPKAASSKATAKVEGAPGAATASPPASTASSETSTAAPDFETVKKAFLALSVKDGGRARCEQVLKPFALAKLSEAKPEQYNDILQAIHKAAA